MHFTRRHVWGALCVRQVFVYLFLLPLFRCKNDENPRAVTVAVGRASFSGPGPRGALEPLRSSVPSTQIPLPQAAKGGFSLQSRMPAAHEISSTLNSQNMSAEAYKKSLNNFAITSQRHVCVVNCSDAQKAQIAANEQLVRSNQFKITRNLASYSREMPGLSHKISSLNEKNRFLDLGAGVGFAGAQLLEPYYDPVRAVKPPQQSPDVTLVGMAKTGQTTWMESVPPLSLAKSDGKYRYHDHDFLLLTTDEINKNHESHPGFDVITDFFGAFSYSPKADAVLNKALALLRVNGELYIRHDNLTSTVRTKAQGPVFLADWIKSNIEKYKNIISFEYHNQGNVMVFKRHGAGEVKLPALELLSLKPSQPSERMYQE